MRLDTKGLELLTLAPVLLFLVLAGVSFYFTILKPVDEFVDASIRDSLVWMTQGVYGIADRNVEALMIDGSTERAKMTRIRKVSALMGFEDFARENEIVIVVNDVDTNESIFATDQLGESALEVLDTSAAREGYLSTADASAYYYVIREFKPWSWRITLLKDATSYTSLVKRSGRFYVSTGVILLLIAALLIVYFRRVVGSPINRIVSRIRKNEPPDYKGISEFEFLSDTITKTMNSLQEKTFQLEGTLENMSDGLAVFDEALRLVAWNRQFVSLNRYPDDLVTFGRPYSGFLRHNVARGDYGPGDPDQQLAERLAGAKRRSPDRFEVNREDTWVEISRNPMPDGGFVTTYNDVTERKLAEKKLAEHSNHLEEVVDERTSELRELNRRLEDAVTQMETAKEDAERADQTKSRFLAHVSHDLRTPLHHILSYTQLVINNSRNVLPAKQYQNLENVSTSATRLLTLIQDIIDYTRSEDLHPVEVDLHALLVECLRAVEPAVDATRVQLIDDIAADLPPLVTDQAKLYRILINLLKNAVEFTKEGKVCLKARACDNKIDISVEDTGPGIPEDELERMFGEFEQGERGDLRRHDSTGLGLAISKRFSQLIGGQIGVQSHVGKGSTFTLSIPLQLVTESEARDG